MQKRQLYFSEKIKNYAYNLKYNLLGYWEGAELQKIICPNDRIHILGKAFYINETQDERNKGKQIYKMFINTAWITYRSGFPILLNQLQGSKVTDVGWGCMIRVGQMLFAQILKRHKLSERVNTIEKQQKTLQDDKKQLQEILANFNDFQESAVFSIQNIARVAKKEYNLKPGDWYNPSQIAFILSSLYEKRKINGFQQLTFKVFHSGNLFFDQVRQKMAPKKKNNSQSSSLIQQDQDSCSLCLILLTRIGLQKSEPKYLQVLYQMMESEWFSGILGGKPQKALFFVGKHNNKDFIYLDPHYVHQAKEVQQKQTYFCYSFRKCAANDIDPSIGISFYLKNLKDLNNFRDFMSNLKKKHEQNFFVFMADQTPSYEKQVRKIKEQRVQDEDYFEQL